MEIELSSIGSARVFLTGEEIATLFIWNFHALCYAPAFVHKKDCVTYS